MLIKMIYLENQSETYQEIYLPKQEEIITESEEEENE